MSDLKKELKSGFGDSRWEDLAPHAGRDAIIVVHPSLDLLIVGEAIATDNSALVSQWMEGTLIRKPNLNELDLWSRDAARTFETLIVQPFVLIHGTVEED